MDFKQIEEEERKMQDKRSEILKLAKEICLLKKKTNDLEIKYVAKERELNVVKTAVIEKQTRLDVIKSQVAFLDKTSKQKTADEEKTIEETQERKKRLWGKYKDLVRIAEEEEMKMKKWVLDVKEKKNDKCNKKTNNCVLKAEVEAMREFLSFQKQKQFELMEIINANDIVCNNNILEQ